MTPLERQFVELLDKELYKVEEFYKDQVSKAMRMYVLMIAYLHI